METRYRQTSPLAEISANINGQRIEESPSKNSVPTEARSAADLPLSPASSLIADQPLTPAPGHVVEGDFLTEDTESSEPSSSHEGDDDDVDHETESSPPLLSRDIGTDTPITDLPLSPTAQETQKDHVVHETLSAARPSQFSVADVPISVARQGLEFADGSLSAARPTHASIVDASISGNRQSQSIVDGPLSVARPSHSIADAPISGNEPSQSIADGHLSGAAIPSHLSVVDVPISAARYTSVADGPLSGAGKAVILSSAHGFSSPAPHGRVKLNFNTETTRRLLLSPFSPSLVDKFDASTKENKELLGRNAELTKLCEETIAEYERIAAEGEILQQQLSLAQTSVTKLEEKLFAIEAEKLQLTIQMQQLEKEQTDTSKAAAEEKEKLSAELAEASAHKLELQQALIAVNKEMDQLTEQLSAQAKQFKQKESELTATAEKNKQEVLKLNTTLAEVESEKTQLNLRLQQLENSYAEATDEAKNTREKLNAELTEVKARELEQQEALTTATREAQQLAEQLVAKEKQFQTQKNELTTAAEEAKREAEKAKRIDDEALAAAEKSKQEVETKLIEQELKVVATELKQEQLNAKLAEVKARELEQQKALKTAIQKADQLAEQLSVQAEQFKHKENELTAAAAEAKTQNTLALAAAEKNIQEAEKRHQEQLAEIKKERTETSEKMARKAIEAKQESDAKIEQQRQQLTESATREAALQEQLASKIKEIETVQSEKRTIEDSESKSMAPPSPLVTSDLIQIAGNLGYETDFTKAQSDLTTIQTILKRLLPEDNKDPVSTQCRLLLSQINALANTHKDITHVNYYTQTLAALAIKLTAPDNEANNGRLEELSNGYYYKDKHTKCTEQEKIPDEMTPSGFTLRNIICAAIVLISLAVIAVAAIKIGLAGYALKQAAEWILPQVTTATWAGIGTAGALASAAALVSNFCLFPQPPVAVKPKADEFKPLIKPS